MDMIKRIAIPIENEKLSEYFGECSYCQIFEIDGAVTGHRRMKFPAGMAVSELPGWLKDLGITDVITYKINPKIIHLFASKKVNLFVGVSIDLPMNLIDAYLQGKLESDEKIIKEITMVIEK